MDEGQVLAFWLANHGFETNPFASKEADFEVAGDQSRVVDYFVRAIWFDQILGEIQQPRSAVLAARRGFGKSASRLMVEYECRRGRLAGLALAVTYTNFERALAAQRGETGQSLHQAHLQSVIENCALALLDYLRENPSQIKNLGYGGTYRLTSLLAGFTRLLDPFKMDEVLRRVNADERILNSQTFLRAARDGTFSDLLDKANVGLQRPWLELLGEVASREIMLENLSLTLVEDLCRLAKLVGLTAIYVLVDRVDELPETAADPTAGADLLRPLLADLRLMEVPGLAFKFFLPQEVSDLLFDSREIRSDRLTRYEINWNEAQLLNFLHNRLLAYSTDNSLSSLAPFCEVNFAHEVDEELSRRAEGSPRNLLRLGELFVLEHCRAGDLDGPLTHDDLERACQKLNLNLQREQAAYRATLAPEIIGSVPAPAPGSNGMEIKPSVPLTGLFLDTARRQIWRDGKLLEPGPVGQEYALLEYLYQNAGRAISKDELLQIIYGQSNFPEVSEEALAQMVSRLRKKVEPNAKATHILTVPRFGYKLEK